MKNAPQSINSKPPLWSDNGATHAEIRSRLAERDDYECAQAQATAIRIGLFDLRNRKAIIDAAEKFRSAVKILDQEEPRIIRRLAELDPDPDLKTQKYHANLLEIFALAVEHNVRTVDGLFPKDKTP